MKKPEPWAMVKGRSVRPFGWLGHPNPRKKRSKGDPLGKDGAWSLLSPLVESDEETWFLSLTRTETTAGLTFWTTSANPAGPCACTVCACAIAGAGPRLRRPPGAAKSSAPVTAMAEAMRATRCRGSILPLCEGDGCEGMTESSMYVVDIRLLMAVAAQRGRRQSGVTVISGITLTSAFPPN